jgi:hypothetical protein
LNLSTNGSISGQGLRAGRASGEVRLRGAGIAAFYKGWQNTAHLSDAVRNDLRRLFSRKDVDRSFSVEEAEKDGTSGGGGTAEALKKVMESRIDVVKDGRDIDVSPRADHRPVVRRGGRSGGGKGLQGKDRAQRGRVLG